jgi:hypothetical protein
VADGVTCDLEGAIVHGNVKVAAGGILTVCGSTIDGGIVGTDANVTVGGASDNPPCAGNLINGDVTVSDSGTNTVEVDGNTITEDVELNNNGTVEVEGNTIGGDLNCAGNGTIGNDGFPNIVTGAETGQCVGL